MDIQQLDAALIRKAFLAAASELESNKDWINELNVFPVPDGDTGTNMTLTIMTAAQDVAALDEPDVPKLCKTISSGSLRGARGNSGVILSQLLRGFTKEIAEKDDITVQVLSAAMVRATETAYKAVMKPKEGTILTVARAMSTRASEIKDQYTDIVAFTEDIIKAGDEALEMTPELLPVLKQAGVVDSGGQGLMVVMKGALKGMTGKAAEFSAAASFVSGEHEHISVDTSSLDTSEITFGYCTEFIVNLAEPLPDEEVEKFKDYLSSLGDSLVCVASDEFVKVHVHTNDPGLAIQKGLSYGPLSRMKIDNMREEHHERLIKNASQIAAQEKKKADEEKQRKAEEEKKRERKPYGFVSVSVGAGLEEIFRGIGVDNMISGGQTMNPSTQDVLNAVAEVNADTVYVLPNNKNIILAAEQARDLVKDRKVIVVPTTNIPQGINAMISFMPEADPEENLNSMKDAAASLKTAQITYAVRDTSIDGFEIHEGDIMAIGDHGMLTVEKSVPEAVKGALAKITDEDTELITLYYGADVSKEDAEKLCGEITEIYPDAEVEMNEGGQPVYYYFVSAE
ncbi:MAG: DAK2 domain-containing protein [Stomatobaculum sp.]|nr:DAK2 domain-containing protein [Stomatobaculum sp.]